MGSKPVTTSPTTAKASAASTAATFQVDVRLEFVMSVLMALMVTTS
ncbi:hypothetical protein [Clavibacter tessellarius]